MSIALSRTRCNKKSLMITIFLILTIALTLVALPAAQGHTPPWTIQSYLKMHVSPNPVGVGQQVYIVMFTTWALPGAAIGNDIRFHNFKLTITTPNGSKEVRNYPVVPDSGGSVFTFYTPTEIGTYSLLLEYPGQVYEWSGSYANDIILGSNRTVTFEVQQEQIGQLPFNPLPTEYWTRPIDAENFLWDEISSNWLAGAAVGDRWQKEGSAPKTPHVMWTKPIQLGGLVGGNQSGGPDATYYGGFSYETRFNDPMIISGILYYRLPLGHSGSGGGFAAVDLRTGEQIWYRDDITPTKGQLFNFQQTPNQHGVVGGLLWQTQGSTWTAYDALTGKDAFTLTGVPSGTEVYATGYDAEQNNGMIVRYVFNYNTNTKSGWLALWNNTLAVTSVDVVQSGPGWRPNGNTYDASDAYSWNVTITADLTGSQSPRIVGIIPGDLILGSSADVSLASNWKQTPNPYTMWAISDRDDGTKGNLLWKKDYPAPPNNMTRMLGHQPIDIVNRVYLMTDRETTQRYGYSLDTGDLEWAQLGNSVIFNTTVQDRASLLMVFYT